MPEMVLTPNPIAAKQIDGSPVGCTLCLSPTGPFVVIGQSTYTLQTANGPVVVDSPLILCAPIIDPDNGAVSRQGCAGTIARTAGYVGPDELANAQAQAGDAIARTAELEGEANELRASQVNVIPVNELMKLIESAGATVQ